MSLAEKLRQRIAELEAAPRVAAAAAAPRIEAKLRSDATTRHGGTPTEKASDGGGPITVTAQGDGLLVTAPDWVLRKAREKGQTAEWGAIVAEELAKATAPGST